jgi:hypothetical protein
MAQTITAEPRLPLAREAHYGAHYKPQEVKDGYGTGMFMR